MAEVRPALNTRRSNSAPSTPQLDSSSVQSRSPPSSPRISSARNSIRRKPAPTVQGDEEMATQGQSGGEGEETLRDSDGAVSPAMRRGNSAGSGSDYGRSMPPSPSSASSPYQRHAFPPQPRRTGSASSFPRSSPTPYSAAAPSNMSAAARGPHPSTSRETMDLAAHHRQKLAIRPSHRSEASLVAADNPYNSAPRGVIGKSRPREVIRIDRDYSEGELCQFWSGWIWELEGRISPVDFQNTMNEINEVLASAHDPYQSCFDNCCAILTLYISPRVLGSHYDREMTKFERVLERANREVYNPAGLNILHPRRNAFLFLELEYY